MSDQLEKNLNNVNDISQLREVLLQTLASEGTIVRSRDSEFNNRLTRQPEPNVSLPANNFKFEKELTFNPESGRRNLMLRANTMEDLTALENQILGRI
jgi:hypothetical protein